MGLVMVGSLNSAAFQDMVQYICDTQHDKIQRGLRTGISLLAYGLVFFVVAVFHILNGVVDEGCSAAFKVATDPNNDVKRFSVMGIGFLLSKNSGLQSIHGFKNFMHDTVIGKTPMTPEDSLVGRLRMRRCSPMPALIIFVAYAPTSSYKEEEVEALSMDLEKFYREHHAFYKVIIGDFNAKEAVSLLEPLLSAKENYVRQGAVIALSFIYVQQTDVSCPKVGEFRKQLTKMTTEKGEDSMAKFGAIIAQGILDVGGRNMTIALHNRSGTMDMAGAVGMMVFQQFWYWHSMVPFISLACKPTCLIALTKDLQMPKIEFKCNARASLFAYPPPLESKKKEEHEKVETAVLSISHKKKAAKKGTEERMEIDEDSPKIAKEEEKKTVPDSESPTHSIYNPARVVRLQLKTVSMLENSRYKPVKSITYGGIIMLLDRTPDQKAEMVAQAVAGGTTLDPAAPEKQAHSSFEIDLKDY
ncbi:hypothetical protein NECAME_10381 [Necator americanus]|uniref:26S proteasome regulatory subunit RPN2 C-terminal domain-containing protein n=1 Tax=Necator americanus TaxID=51031 RepID=W2T9W6_NECAM|nr:hypothetical protein NECAME_10381 [Necator americanus]ETN78384.1 hypothetical protein NECAME_10381 [Necator americanus]